MHDDFSPEIEALARQVVDAGLAVHRALGPGLLESAYQHCLAFELMTRSISVKTHVSMPILYRGESLDAGYRLDLVVDEIIVIELKAVESLTRLHEAQLLTYLRLSGCQLGFLMNFNTVLFKHGLKRVVLTNGNFA